MYSIGILSQKTGVKIPTIRYYEQSGLLDLPERSQGNQRRYSQDGLKRLSFIRHARELGFSIEDIRDLIKLGEHPEQPCADAHNIATRHLADIRTKLSSLRRLERELKRLTKCKSKDLENCAVIETLVDHALCLADH